MFVLQWNEITRLGIGGLLCSTLSYHPGQRRIKSLGENTSSISGANGLKIQHNNIKDLLPRKRNFSVLFKLGLQGL